MILLKDTKHIMTVKTLKLTPWLCDTEHIILPLSIQSSVNRVHTKHLKLCLRVLSIHSVNNYCSAQISTSSCVLNLSGRQYHSPSFSIQKTLALFLNSSSSFTSHIYHQVLTIKQPKYFLNQDHFSSFQLLSSNLAQSITSYIYICFFLWFSFHSTTGVTNVMSPSWCKYCNDSSLTTKQH